MQGMRVVTAVVDRFVRTGLGSTQREIAEEMGVSTSAVSKAFRDAHGLIDGLLPRDRPLYVPNKDYPMLGGRTIRVTEWVPTIEVLREVILRAGGD